MLCTTIIEVVSDYLIDGSYMTYIKYQIQQIQDYILISSNTKLYPDLKFISSHKKYIWPENEKVVSNMRDTCVLLRHVCIYASVEEKFLYVCGVLVFSIVSICIIVLISCQIVLIFCNMPIILMFFALLIYLSCMYGI